MTTLGGMIYFLFLLLEGQFSQHSQTDRKPWNPQELQGHKDICMRGAKAHKEIREICPGKEHPEGMCPESVVRFHLFNLEVPILCLTESQKICLYIDTFVIALTMHL